MSEAKPVEAKWSDEELLARYHAAFGKMPDAHHWALLCWMRDDLTATIATLEQERDKIRNAIIKELRETEQSLGAALGYPYYCDDPANFPDATEADGVCVGEHTVATLAQEAAQRIATLEQELKSATKRYDAMKEATLDENTLHRVVADVCEYCGGTGTRMEWTDTLEGGEYAPYPCECKCRVVAEEEANNAS